MQTTTQAGSDVRETHNLIASDKVEGTPVRRSDGEKIGTIERVMIEKRSGKVAYAVMSFGGFMGLGEEYYTLPWGVLKYNTQLDAYELNLNEDQLRGAPRRTAEGHDASYDREWEEHVHRYYNATSTGASVGPHEQGPLTGRLLATVSSNGNRPALAGRFSWCRNAGGGGLQAAFDPARDITSSTSWRSTSSSRRSCWKPQRRASCRPSRTSWPPTSRRRGRTNGPTSCRRLLRAGLLGRRLLCSGLPGGALLRSAPLRGALRRRFRRRLLGAPLRSGLLAGRSGRATGAASAVRTEQARLVV